MQTHSVDYIRGLAMLGVIGIHTGAWSLTYPQPNIHLVALMEIVSRFCVPIFFFVSAFGLFRRYPVEEPLEVSRFMTRRMSRVLLPYLGWSLFYMVNYTLMTHDWSIWYPSLFAQFLIFGKASYHMYFLVILLWFYLLMPLWRLMVRVVLQRPVPWLIALLVMQIVFNYYSSYQLRPNFGNAYVDMGIANRMSWWVAHYIFLFVLGGVFAQRFEDVLAWLHKYRKAVTFLFWSTMSGLLAHYYLIVLVRGQSPEQAINTAHQLSPVGVLYTVAACLYLVERFDRPLSPAVDRSLQTLSNHSYFVFLIHPFYMFHLHSLLAAMGVPISPLVSVGFYLAAFGLSLATSVIWERLHRSFSPK
jgi:surface polysaccharide O-acyltransferase-like enzyme